MKRAIALFALIAGPCAFPPANVYGSPGQDVTQATATERQTTVPSDSPELQTEELSLAQHWELANELAKTGDLTRAASIREISLANGTFYKCWMSDNVGYTTAQL